MAREKAKKHEYIINLIFDKKIPIYNFTQCMKCIFDYDFLRGMQVYAILSNKGKYEILRSVNLDEIDYFAHELENHYILFKVIITEY